MSVLDKVLLVLLIVMLPLGVLAVRHITSDETPEEVTGATVEELEQLLRELNEEDEHPVAQVPEPPTLSISSVSRSTESGVVRVAGSAPHGGVSVMVTATVLPNEFNQPDEVVSPDEPGVLGQQTSQQLVPVQASGVFVLELPVSTSSGKVELHLSQAKAQTVVQYDLDEGEFEVW